MVEAGEKAWDAFLVPALVGMMTQEEQQFCNNCGAANPPTARFCQQCATLLPFTHITGSLPEQTLLAGRYQLVSRIGQGGMGAVYKGADTRLNNRAVAIKEMSSAGLQPVRLQEAQESFAHEAHLLADLSHPNLPGIYDHFTENERSYLVMEFIEGETLEEYLERNEGGTGEGQPGGVQKLPKLLRPRPYIAVDKVLRWAEQLCDVLSYLHNHQPPIIFRDLKPSNVMLDKNEHIFLIDFGIARIFKPGQQHDTVALGSPGYAAPEQYGKAQSTPRSDIYSLGALLHHLLTGLDPSEQPFFFRPASQVNPAVDPGLDALLQQMLEMDAERRPKSAQDVLRALHHHTPSYMVGAGLAPALGTSALVAQPAAVTDPLLQKAQQLYTTKHLNEALVAYSSVLQKDTTNPLGWEGYGLTQGTLSRHQEALDAFERALELNSSRVLSWVGKGTALMSLGKPREALVSFERALQLDPKNADAWNGKGSALSALGQTVQAVNAFDTALRYNPLMAIGWQNKGLVLTQQKRYSEALTAFEKALNCDTTLAIAWSGKGTAQHELGQLPGALNSFQQALQYKPKYVPALSGLGMVLFDLGRDKEALDAFDRALQLDATYAPALFGRGQVFYAQRKLRQALRMFEQATQYDANYAEAWNRHANVLDELGDPRALQSYERALSIDPRLATAWSGKGGVLRQRRRYLEALKAYETALGIDPNMALAWNGKGNTLYHLGRYAEALDAYNRSLRLNPRSTAAWHNKSMVLNLMGRYDEALDAAEEAIRLSPDDPDHWSRKGESLRGLRRKREAKNAEAEAERLRGR